MRKTSPQSNVIVPPLASPASVYVEIAGVGKAYGVGAGKLVALEDINLCLRQGEFVSIVGPSGCGKSTLVKCVAGLEKVTTGVIRIQDQIIEGPPKNLGMVFQRDVLADWRNVLDNVLLVSEFRRRDRRMSENRARELLDLFGLSESPHRYPWELSGGMRQRAAICRALVDDPEFLLMDEPFGALDAMTRDQLNVELQRIWLNSRKTVLFITHGIAEAVFLSDRVVMMSRNPGRVIETIDIDLPRPRHLSIRETSTFGAYVSRVRKLFMSLGILKDE